MDASSFLSSLAQSVAAIVGILAAFATSRLIADQAEFRRKNARTRYLLAESNILAERAARTSFGWYSLRQDSQVISSVEQALAEGTTLEPEELFRRTPFSPFTPKEENLKRVRDLVAHWRGPHAESVLKSYYARRQGIETGAIARELQQLRDERQVIDEFVADLRRHLHECREHLSDLRAQSESSSVVILTIITSVLLFYVGVIYPLSFMPLADDKELAFSSLTLNVLPPVLSLRGLMLAVPTAVVTVVAVFSIYVTRFKRRYPNSELKKLAQFTTWDAYSEFLVTWERNQTKLTVGDAA